MSNRARVLPHRRRVSSSRLLRYFDHNPGHLMHKWEHYFAIYERHFEPYRGTAPVVLEIGVSHGGSLQMWREYFGRNAAIVGVDIEPRVAELAAPGISIEVGDQSDPEFLRAVAAKHGPFDIVIDDGSHEFAHQITSIETLWPHVVDGGVYLVEDLHTSYWRDGYGGGLGEPSTFVEWLKHRIDDMHAYHSRESGFDPTDWTRTVQGMHLYDSVAVLGKGDVGPPHARMTGRPVFTTTYGRDTEQFIDDPHRAQLDAHGAGRARIERLLRHPVPTVRRVVRRWTRSATRR